MLFHVFTENGYEQIKDYERVMNKHSPDISSKIYELEKSVSKIQNENLKAICSFTERNNSESVKTYQVDRTDLKILENRLVKKIEKVQLELTNFVYKLSK